MAQGKKSFMFYCDWRETFRALPKEKGYDLLMHILDFVNDDEPETEDVLVKAVFAGIEQQLVRDLEKWKKRQNQRKEAGVKSAEARRAKSNESQRPLNENEQEPAKSTVIDTVTVIGKGIDTVIVKENKESSTNTILMSEIKISDVKEDDIDYFKIAKAFYDRIRDNLVKIRAPIGNLKKQKADRWIRTIRLMIDSDECTKDQFTSVWNFLETDEFWIKNIQSPEKLRKHFTTLYSNSREKSNNNNQQGELAELERSIREALAS